jgi:5,5'-dehydrodivanillate O-demethylase oxygenase subunit
MRSFWQPVYRSADLAPGQARQIRIMSQDLTLYRGEGGTAHVVDERCAHRGAKMAIAWVEGDALRCAYHGWKYDASGQCLEQPAEPRPFADKVRIRSFPTREYIGMVFAYLGEGEPPEFQRTPEFEDRGFVSEVSYQIWPANYFAQLENALDYAHTEFLHWHFHYKTPREVVTQQTDFGISMYTPGLSGVASYYDAVHFHMPNTHEWSGPPQPGERTGQFARSWRVPCDDESHIRFDVKVTPLSGKDADEFRARDAERQKKRSARPVPEIVQDVLAGETSLARIKAEKKLWGSDLICVQDLSVMASLGPMASREHHEQLGQTDVGVALMRRLWTQELKAFATGGKRREWKRPDSLWEKMWNAMESA